MRPGEPARACGKDFAGPGQADLSDPLARGNRVIGVLSAGRSVEGP